LVHGSFALVECSFKRTDWLKTRHTHVAYPIPIVEISAEEEERSKLSSFGLLHSIFLHNKLNQHTNFLSEQISRTN
jgi:hypothetical protein